MKKTGLDATDIRILSAVQNNGQISKTRLAEIVNLSPTPCWERLNRLKTAGFITGYRAEIALSEGEQARLPEGVTLIPGMPVEAFIRTADRTPLDYLTKPLTDYFAKAFRE